jgi:hypothetical protein
VEAIDAHTVKFTLLDRLELRIMKEGVTRVAALRTGEVDFANYIPAEHMERLARDPQIQVIRGRDTQRIQCFFDLRKPVFHDVRVRRALLGYGLDRQAIAKTALLGLAQPLWSFVPPGSKGRIAFGDQFPHDPEKAKALLKEAGYDEQNPLRYTLMSHAAEAALPSVATIMKARYADRPVCCRGTGYLWDRPTFKSMRIDGRHVLGLLASGRSVEQVAHGHATPVEATQILRPENISRSQTRFGFLVACNTAGEFRNKGIR